MMNSLIKSLSILRNLRLTSNCLKINPKLTSNAFHSTAPQKSDIDWTQTDDNRKDMPDPTLANPYQKAKRQCILCKYGIHVDYKNVQLLSQFVSPYTGRLYDKHITGLCEKQQQLVRRQHMKAVRYSLMSAVYRDPKYHKDPRLFDPTRPERPNPY